MESLTKTHIRSVNTTPFSETTTVDITVSRLQHELYWFEQLCLKASESENVDKTRVAFLKKSIETGGYIINAKIVAEKMVDFEQAITISKTSTG